MRALVLSSRLTDRRRAAFQALAYGLAELSFVQPDDLLPSLSEHDAIVVDGRPSAQPIETLGALRAAVERGVPLVGIGAAPAERNGFWADLLGVIGGPEPPAGEYFATVTSAHSHISDRAPREFAVVDGFVPLIPLGAGKAIVNVRVALRDHAAVVETAGRCRPRGRVRARQHGRGAAHSGPRPAPRPGAAPRSPLLRPQYRCRDRRIRSARRHGLSPRARRDRDRGIELIAVADPNVERRKAAETDFPGVRSYASASELVTDDDVEVVFVAAPPALHASLTLDLLRAGKHVVCEKPLCLTVAEADQIIRTAAANDRVLTVYQNRRWDPDFVAVRRAVETGLSGTSSTSRRSWAASSIPAARGTRTRRSPGARATTGARITSTGC
jgi:hypothetical protein